MGIYWYIWSVCQSACLSWIVVFVRCISCIGSCSWKKVCLSVYLFFCMCVLYFCTLKLVFIVYISFVLAAALGRLYVDNWRHGGNHPPTTIGLSTSTCSLDLRHIHGFRRNTNTNTNENTSTNTYVFIQIALHHQPQHFVVDLQSIHSFLWNTKMEDKFLEPQVL